MEDLLKYDPLMVSCAIEQGLIGDAFRSEDHDGNSLFHYFDFSHAGDLLFIYISSIFTLLKFLGRKAFRLRYMYDKPTSRIRSLKPMRIHVTITNKVRVATLVASI